MTVAARAHTLVPHWDPTRTSGITDHGRGLLDATALALHVLWTYQEAWADEGALANARLPASVWRLLALVGYHPDPGTAAQGLQHLRAKDGVTAVLPPGFRVSAPAVGDLPAATYETARAITVRAELNELRPFLPVLAPPPPRPGRSPRRSSSSSTHRRSSSPACSRSRTRLGGRFAAGRWPRSPHATRRARGSRPSRRRTCWPSSGTPVRPTSAARATTRCARSSARPPELGLAVPDGLGPLSESQEMVAAQLRQMALRQPQALAGLEGALSPARR